MSSKPASDEQPAKERPITQVFGLPLLHESARIDAFINCREWGPVSAGTIMQGGILQTDGHIHEKTEDGRKYSSTP